MRQRTTEGGQKPVWMVAVGETGGPGSAQLTVWLDGCPLDDAAPRRLTSGTSTRRGRALGVLASTGGEQRPHEYHSLLSKHYLSGPPTADSVTVS